jgi:arylsulfatase A-like enzyme
MGSKWIGVRKDTLAAAVAVVCAHGCGRAPQAPIAVRLVDLYRPEAVQARAPAKGPPARIEWRFDADAGDASGAPSAAGGWQALHGVSGLARRSGRLAGRASSDLPILHLERTSGLDDADLLHEVQIRLRASAGGNVAFDVDGAPKVDTEEIVQAARDFPAAASAPLSPGGAMQSVTLRSRFSIPLSRARHVFVRPTDQAGATFEIESIRLVTRREHLAGVPSGLGWHGLSEVYKETLVARAPEALQLRTALPARPWLDLAVGTIEDGPVTFRVSVADAARSGKDADVLLERTVTRPHRWESAALDLAAYGGREVTLSLSLAAEKAGALGFWGAPAVRSLGALPTPKAAAVAPFEPPQGVIVVWADTLRRDHLSAYGYGRPTSPVLDRLAAEGTLFQDCVGQASWTKVATPSLMTSLYPTSHGVLDFFDRLPASAVTLAEAYRDAGYATLSLSSILFTGKFTNLHQGFEEVHEDGSLPDRRSSKTAREYVDRLLPWLEAHRQLPFFVFLHVSDPHDPYKPYPPYDTLWADASKSEPHEREAKEVKEFIGDPLMKLFGMPTRAELVEAGIDPQAYVSQDRDWYDGSIRAMDAELGRLVERLRALGLERRTLLVFIADHGEEFLEHGRMFHGQSVYGELTNMPLVLWGPGLAPSGRVIEETVQTIDVMPTLLEASRLPLPSQLQGRSLWPLLAGAPGAVRAAGERPAISEKAATSAGTGAPPPRETASTAIVSGGWKLIHNTGRAQGSPEYELFERRKDLLDRVNVAGQHPDVVARLAKDLEKWRIAAAAARLEPDASTSQSLSPEEAERLRALGYIQ